MLGALLLGSSIELAAQPVPDESGRLQSDSPIAPWPAQADFAGEQASGDQGDDGDQGQAGLGRRAAGARGIGAALYSELLARLDGHGLRRAVGGRGNAACRSRPRHQSRRRHAASGTVARVTCQA